MTGWIEVEAGRLGTSSGAELTLVTSGEGGIGLWTDCLGGLDVGVGAVGLSVIGKGSSTMGNTGLTGETIGEVVTVRGGLKGLGEVKGEEGSDRVLLVLMVGGDTAD